MTRQHIHTTALAAAHVAFEEFLITGRDQRVRPATEAAIAAYQAALWQPLDDGAGLPSDNEPVIVWAHGQRSPTQSVFGVTEEGYCYIIYATHIRNALALPERPFWVKLISRWRFLTLRAG